MSITNLSGNQDNYNKIEEPIDEKKCTGWLNINKPMNMTSCDVVNILKKKFGLKQKKLKIGHAGTLDPMATGVLPVAIGRENTKKIDCLMNAFKEYDFTIKFGLETDSGDITGNVLNRNNQGMNFSIDDVKEAIKCFIGEIDQIPPKYSAIKISGKRAYDLARQNIDFEMKKRKISIYKIEVLHFDPHNHQVSFVVSCSKGTYVRTLASDISIKLNTLGTVSQLNRRKVGTFDIEEAVSIDCVQFNHIIQEIPLI